MPAPKDPIAYALWKKRMSDARQGEKNGNYGKHLTEEQKAKISKTRIERGVAVGEKNPMYGVHLEGHWKGKNLPDAMKQKISESRKGLPAWNKGLPSPWTKGIPRSDETKAKISEANKGKNVGKPSWNKGIPFSEESKKKMSDAKIGKKMSDEFKQQRSEIMTERWADPAFREDMTDKHTGENNANFGKPLSDEQKQKLSEWERTPEYLEKLRVANLGKRHSDETKTKMSEAHAGEKCYNWKGGITPLNLHIRTTPRYKNICAELMKEVDYTDKFTGKRDGSLLACHHIIPQNVIIRMYNIKTIDDARNCPLLFDKHNMVVMLSSAHDKFHNLYGDGKNIYELTDAEILELYN